MAIPYVDSRKLSRVYFFKNAKVDPKYEDVVLPSFFPTNTEALFEANFGAEMRIPADESWGTFKDNQYIRIEDNKVRVDIGWYCGGRLKNETPICHPNDLYQCNYMVITNSGLINYTNLEDMSDWSKREPYNSYWYCCFLNNARYINDSVIEFEYEVDIFNTYWCTPDNSDGNPWSSGQYEKTFSRTTVVHPCFVEREHSNTDTIGDNLIEENLELGDYTVMDVDTHLFGDWMVLITATKNIAGEPPVGQTFANIYTPLYMLANIRVSQPNQINEALQWFIDNGQEDSIISIQEYPASFGVNQIAEDDITITRPVTIDGYNPRNKKLFTYPYCKLVVTNRSGGSAEYRWEQWDAENRGKFKTYSCALGDPTIITVPEHYRGKSIDFDSGLTWQNAPVCPFAGDAYKAYWAQHKWGAYSSVTAGLTAMTLSAIGLATGNVGPAIASGMMLSGGSAIGNILAKRNDTQAIPNQMHGQVNTDYLTAGLNQQRFEYQKVTIRSQFARVIDDYFTAFGYATNRVKVPNFYSGSARQNFCYVKCQGAKVSGKFPAPVKKQFEDILNRGVRFWKNYNNYLNLNASNGVS